MEKTKVTARLPNATYRLQFNRYFTFTDAGKIVDYLYDLGISDIYSSPFLKARSGSLHGYDIIDPTAINPEVGTEDELAALCDKLAEHGMGQIIDIVPNHMGIADAGNTWWMDLLENGPSSAYADFFDIDWNPIKVELKNKILAPVLGDQYGNILERGELRLAFEEGAFFVYYYEHKFPLIPKSYPDIINHHIERLESVMAADDEHYLELLSIITSIGHLPFYTDVDMEKVTERRREKEIIKKRLWSLYNASAIVREHIDANVQIFNGVPGDSASFNHLDKLLSRQVFRLSFWRVATEEINYRRFFDINDLGAIRVEAPYVFAETHKLILHLIREGKVTGIRVDHPDGLYDPLEYFRLLQKHCYANAQLCAGADAPMEDLYREYDEIIADNPDYKAFYIVGEKILTKGERLSEDWQIFSTTGYAFLNDINGVFINTRNMKAFHEIYRQFTGIQSNFAAIAYEKKKLVMQASLSSEINTLGQYLNLISEGNRHTRDFTLNSLTSAIIEVIAFFPVYRTYTNSFDVKEKDKQYIEYAVAKAKRHNPALNVSIFNFLRDVLCLNFPSYFSEREKQSWLNFAMRFQQITGPIMAKGLEDTAFYVYNRFVSLNEVGGNPERFGITSEVFHGHNIERRKARPHAMIATQTHDTKRSEDMRARINILSEIPEEWKERLVKWRRVNKKRKVMTDGCLIPDSNDEYLYYQTLLGAWPLGEMNDADYETFKNRIRDYMIKAVREAKVNTSWINPNADYENALLLFIDETMKRSNGNSFINDVNVFRKTISALGLYNSLSQTLLKITSPGIPDFYQGTELWNFTLVDPDNRKPVDYGERITALNTLKKMESETPKAQLAKWLADNMYNGLAKMYLIRTALAFRKKCGDLFRYGDYMPLETVGAKADFVIAFARKLDNKCAVIAVPRFPALFMKNKSRYMTKRQLWGDTTIRLPLTDEKRNYHHLFTGKRIDAENGSDAMYISARDVFTDFPVAIIYAEQHLEN